MFLSEVYEFTIYLSTLYIYMCVCVSVSQSVCLCLFLCLRVLIIDLIEPVNYNFHDWNPSKLKHVPVHVAVYTHKREDQGRVELKKACFTIGETDRRNSVETRVLPAKRMNWTSVGQLKETACWNLWMRWLLLVPRRSLKAPSWGWGWASYHKRREHAHLPFPNKWKCKQSKPHPTPKEKEKEKEEITFGSKNT